MADEEVAARLEIGVGERVLFVRRLRLADERPIFVCDSHLPVGRFPALKDADYGAISLSRLFEESTGRKVEYSRQWIGAATATPDVAALLEICRGSRAEGAPYHPRHGRRPHRASRGALPPRTLPALQRTLHRPVEVPV